MLSSNIIPGMEHSTGECDYCSSHSDLLVETALLRDHFESLLSIYTPTIDGETLPKLIRSDWALFDHPVMDDAHVKELLGDILDDGELVRRKFAPLEDYERSPLANWDKLREEMMHRNRWFLDEKVDLARLGQLLDHLLVEENALGTIWYRARLLQDDQPYPIDKMSAPPRKSATHGRANPAGIPYLYLGSTPETAASEVRPHTGDSAQIARFEVPTVRAVDLRNPRKTVSPFILEDSDEIGQLRADLPLLERLGSELTRPVLPRSSAFEYIPSQYFCEFIKSSGFDGVVYRSSVSEGINLALFDSNRATAQEVSTYGVDRVSVVVTER